MEDTFECAVSNPKEYLDCFLHGLEKRNPNQPFFQQAVKEVAQTVVPYMFEKPRVIEQKILERMTEPDRVISFRVTWEDDQGAVRINRGYRVQFSNAIGPYKGGLRFHPSVNLDVLKFLAFEQIFKNGLTSLPLGAGKGGADFNPKGKSDAEIMRFCQSYMIQLARFIGPNVDVPAGDIGVGQKEISYLYGQYKRLTGRFSGSLTGKMPEFGGSLMRKEATGYGLVYFAKEALAHHDLELKSKRCLVSGAGNVALHAARKLIEQEAKVVTLSDSKGFIRCEEGLTLKGLDSIEAAKGEGKKLKEIRLSNADYHDGLMPWKVEADLAFPCATQNEIDSSSAETLVANGVKGVFEGANMPSDSEAIELFQENQILFGPGKAANAGGVAVSGLEMGQNSTGVPWSREQVDDKLGEIMSTIHERCVEHAGEAKVVDYLKGANIAGFKKVSEAMLAYGIL